MGNDVFANGREIACKAGAGKSICAFPDVCMTPPENPATPPGVPIPYPNTGMDSDTTSGTTTVKISGKEVMLKDKSYFKQSTGDEAGAAAKKGVVTSVNKGKVYFTAWSMDVKFEGENVVRHLDLTTHNHASAPPQTPPWPFAASMVVNLDPCADEKEAEESACARHGGNRAAECSDPGCQATQACKLVPYGGSGSPNCCEGQTGHHLIEDHWVQGVPGFPMAQGNSGRNNAPTVCAEGSRYDGQHGILHAVQGVHEDSFLPPNGVNYRAGRTWNYANGRKAALRAHTAAFGNQCRPGCISAQLRSFYGPDHTPSRTLEPPTQRQPLGDGRRADGDAITAALFGGPAL